MTDERDGNRAPPGLRSRDTAAHRGVTDDGPRRRNRAQDETSLRGGILGIVAVTLATVVITAVGALIALVVALLF